MRIASKNNGKSKKNFRLKKYASGRGIDAKREQTLARILEWNNRVKKIICRSLSL